MLEWRLGYLCQVRELSASGRPIVFLEKTLVNAHHSVGRKWYSDSSKAGDPILTEVPTAKGKRLIILHAGCKDGFLLDCALIFEKFWVADNVKDEVAELTIEIDGQGGGG